MRSRPTTSLRRHAAAVLGVLLLFVTACQSQTTVTAPTPAVDADSELGTSDSDEAEPAPTVVERQVLVAIAEIPRGTSANEILQDPTVFLAVRMVPEEFAVASAIESFAELEESIGMVLTSSVVPGEQLIRERFRDPSDFAFQPAQDASSAPGPLGLPADHELRVLEVPRLHAGSGFIRAGDQALVIATTIVGEAQTESTVLFDAVKVLSFEFDPTFGTFDADPDAEPIEKVGIALEPAQMQALDAARADSAILTFVSLIDGPDQHDMAIEMPSTQARDGEARSGDIVDIVAVDNNGGDGFLVASQVEVRSVFTGLGDPESDVKLIVAVDTVQALAITAAMARGDVTLAAI